MGFNKYIDLHIHSTHSDGLYSPGKIVRIAADKKLAAISITDHDQISAIVPAQEKAELYGVEVIPGIEINCMSNDQEVHILGYFFDVNNVPLLEYLSYLHDQREVRAKEIVDKLKHVGINLPYELIELKADGAVIGRPHIADVMVEEGHVFSFNEAFYKYLGDKRPAYVPKETASPEQALRYIRDAGGLSFIAHPGVGISDSVIHHLVTLGLDGLEIYHPQNTPVKRKALNELVEKYDLLVAGGSDCHGARVGETVIGNMGVPYSVLQKMKEKLGIE